MTWKYFRSQLRPQPQIRINKIVLFKVQNVTTNLKRPNLNLKMAQLSQNVPTHNLIMAQLSQNVATF